jgi:hypothetical protein
VTSIVKRWLPCVLALLATTTAGAEIRDLGRYGPTCPVPDPPPPRSGVRVRVEPGLARIPDPVEAPMPIAPTRRVYVLPGRWPAGAPPLVALVGQDAASLAIVRELPPGTPVFVLSPEGGMGLEVLRRVCPTCRIGIAGTAGARRLGIQALPAVVRVVDGVAQVTEGVP